MVIKFIHRTTRDKKMQNKKPIQVYLTQHERSAINDLASEVGLPVSTFMKMRALETELKQGLLCKGGPCDGAVLFLETESTLPITMNGQSGKYWRKDNELLWEEKK